MTETGFVSDSLKKLIEAGKNYPGSDLNICVGFITSEGILNLQPILKSSSKIRVVVGLNLINKVGTFQDLTNDFGAEVYVYPPGGSSIFHPKIYLGITKTNAWALVGSSNLTASGLSTNIEGNIFITGQQHTEPFLSIETNILAFRNQAYLFDRNIEKELIQIEKELPKKPSEYDYKKKLRARGLFQKKRLSLSIPLEVQQAALNALNEFVATTKLSFAYQMLLLLVLLQHSDQEGLVSLEETVKYFQNFYRLRLETGLVLEKKQGAGPAKFTNMQARQSELRYTLKSSPFPRFERRGLLSMSDDEQYFVINPALLTALTPSVKQSLRSLAIRRIAEHFGEDELLIEELVLKSIG